MKRMSKQQAQYAIVKAQLHAARAIEAERLAPLDAALGEDPTDEQLEAWGIECGKIENDLNIPQLAADLRTAEDNMVQWANAKVSKSKHFSPKYKAAMDTIMEAYSGRYSVRVKMIDLAFRLS